MINHTLVPLINQFLTKRDKVSRENVGYEQANNIGILYSHPDQRKSSAILELMGKINQDDKNTSSICLLDSKTFKESPTDNCFGEHEIKLFGDWANPIVSKFYQRKFDYLLHLDSTVNPLTENILLKSSAICRIGLYNENHSHLFEMMIKTADNDGLSFQMMEIYRYLKQLR